MEFGVSGKHGKAALRVVLAEKRFELENVIIQLQIMVESHVLELNKRIVLAINSPAQVIKILGSLFLPKLLRKYMFMERYIETRSQIFSYPHLQLMANGAFGKHGQHVAKLVVLAKRPVLEYATILVTPMVEIRVPDLT